MKFLSVSLAVAVLLLATPVVAQTPVEEIALPRPASCATRGAFTQSKVVAGLPTPIVSSGEFFHHCGRGMIWKINEPIEEALIVDNKQNAWQVANSQRSKISSRASKMISQLMASMLSGDNDALQKNFILSAKQATEHSAADKGLRLIPQTRRFKRALQSLELDLNEADQVEAITIISQTGDQTRIAITQQQPVDGGNSAASCLAVSALGTLECSGLYPELEEPL